MKLLFDENLSHKLPEFLSDIFPDSTHVRNVGLSSADDANVWRFAVDNEFIIVSKDEDMHDRSMVFGFPPKIVWVRLGNCSTAQAEELIRREKDAILSFIEDDVASFLTIS